MPSPSNLPLSFDRDRAVRQLDARFEECSKSSARTPLRNPDVRRAYEIATERHAPNSGNPRALSLPSSRGCAHPSRHAPSDATTLTAALLHDAIEDTEYPVSRIEERFGAEVAHLVEGVTKIGRLNIMAPETRQAETVRKMLLAMVHDVRVVLVKLADRLHNMRTLEYLDSDRAAEDRARNAGHLRAHRASPGNGVVRASSRTWRSAISSRSLLRLAKRNQRKGPFTKSFLEEVQATIQTKLVEPAFPPSSNLA